MFSEFTGSPSLHAVADFHRGLYLLLLPFQSIRLILILQDAVPVNMPAPPPARAAQAAPHVCPQGHQPPGAVPGRRLGPVGGLPSPDLSPLQVAKPLQSLSPVTCFHSPGSPSCETPLAPFYLSDRLSITKERLENRVKFSCPGFCVGHSRLC